MNNNQLQVTPNVFLHENRELIIKGAMREYKTAAFLSSVQLVIRENPALINAIQTDRGRAQFLQVLMKAGQTGYNVSSGPDQEAAIITYGEGANLHIEYQVMKNGHIRAALDSGQVKSIRSAIVYEKDLFDTIRTTEHGDAIKHSFNMFQPRGKIVGAYAEMKMKAGESFVYAANIEELEQVMNSSKMYQKKPDKSAWKNNFAGMAEKTVIKRVIQKTHIAGDAIDEAWTPPAEPVNITPPKGMAPDEIAGAIAETQKEAEPLNITPPKGKKPVDKNQPANNVQKDIF